MAEVKDTANDVVEAFDGSETYDEAEFALRDFSSKEISVTNAMRAAATGGTGGSGGFPIRERIDAYVAPTSQTNFDNFTGDANNGLRFSDNTNGAFLEYPVRLAEGTYALDVQYFGSDATGVLTFSLDGTDIDGSPFNASSADLDTYDGASSGMRFARVADDITIDQGDHTIRATVNGKNVSSSGFICEFYSMTLTRVAE